MKTEMGQRVQPSHSSLYYAIQIAMMDKCQNQSETIEEINARFRILNNKAPADPMTALASLEKGFLLKAYPDHIMEKLFHRVAEEEHMTVPMIMDLATQLEHQKNDFKGIAAQKKNDER